jgi:hypothetical protein
VSREAEGKEERGESREEGPPAREELAHALKLA